MRCCCLTNPLLPIFHAPSVVLLDEVEKAHPDVLTIMLRWEGAAVSQGVSDVPTPLCALIAFSRLG